MSVTTFDKWPIQWLASVDGKDESVVTTAVAAARNLLWALTGRQYGIATTTGELHRPSGAGCWTPGQSGECCALVLNRQPVARIIEVRIDGTVLDPANYTLRGRSLIRTDECWPSPATGCNDPRVAVDYRWGINVPPEGALALGEVAGEYIAALTGAPCRLPSRAISVTRQQVTVQMADPQQFIEAGLTGLPIADSWIRAVNPHGLPSRHGRIVTPDYGGA